MIFTGLSNGVLNPLYSTICARWVWLSRFSNVIPGGHVAVRLAMREQVVGRIEPIAPVLVTADVSPLGIVVEVTPGGEVCSTPGSANACKIMVVELAVSLLDVS